MLETTCFIDMKPRTERKMPMESGAFVDYAKVVVSFDPSDSSSSNPNTEEPPPTSPVEYRRDNTPNEVAVLQEFAPKVTRVVLRVSGEMGKIILPEVVQTQILKVIAHDPSVSDFKNCSHLMHFLIGKDDLEPEEYTREGHIEEKWNARIIHRYNHIEPGTPIAFSASTDLDEWTDEHLAVSIGQGCCISKSGHEEECDDPIMAVTSISQELEARNCTTVFALTPPKAKRLDLLGGLRRLKIL